MAEPHALLNALSDAEAREVLTRCCGSTRWVELMLARRPYADRADLFTAAEDSYAQLERADLLEAFSHHPRIGGDLAALRARFGTHARGASDERGGTLGASEETLEALRGGNLQYEARFGYIFIICATGESAAEVLARLRARLVNSPERELAIAAGEQLRITRLRLEKLAQSKLTTRAIDTSLGRPAANLSVRLEHSPTAEAWVTIAERVTDLDGQVRDLLAGRALQASTYRLTFDVGPYFAASARVCFYPEVVIVFTVRAPDEHHHVPLLLGPYGYSTYRGS